VNDDAEARDAEMIDRLYEGGADPDGLGLVRSLVARVREEHAGVEPPQAVSARLLQAAEEHAPRKKAVAVAAESPGLMERLRRWWMPVSGAVMVAGALALYLNQGGKAAERKQHVEQAAEKEETQPAAVATPDPTPTTATPPALAEPEAPREDVAKPEGLAVERGRGKGGGGARKDIGGSGEGAAAGSGSAAGADRYAGDFADDGDDDADKKPVAPTNTTVTIATDRPVAEKKKLEAPPQQQAVPPPPPPRPSEVDDSPNVTTGAGSVAKQEESKEQQRTLSVRDYLVVARAAAKKGDCKRVAQLGAKVKSMDAKYYAKTFATDAAIKGCSK
jgi:hypothetical protein